MKIFNEFKKFGIKTYIIIGLAVVFIVSTLRNLFLRNKMRRFVRKITKMDSDYFVKYTDNITKHNMDSETIKKEYEAKRSNIINKTHNTIEKLKKNDKARIEWLNKFESK